MRVFETRNEVEDAPGPSGCDQKEQLVEANLKEYPQSKRSALLEVIYVWRRDQRGSSIMRFDPGARLADVC